MLRGITSFAVEFVVATKFEHFLLCSSDGCRDVNSIAKAAADRVVN